MTRAHDWQTSSSSSTLYTDPRHPADAVPLATLSSPSSPASDDPEDHHHHSSRVAKLTSADSMEAPPTNHARRRSASLAGAGAANLPGGEPAAKKHQRTQSQPRIEEDGSSSDGELSDSSDKTESTDLELDDMRSDDELEDDEETGLTARDRRRRRRRKRQHTRFDERIVPDHSISKEEEKMASQSMVRSMLINAVLIGLWYFFSISISLYNKWMFKEEEDGETKNIFPFPLFTTCLHMIVQFSLASLVLFLIPAFRPRHDSISNPHSFRGPPPPAEAIDPKKPLMTKWFYFTRLGPCGVATGMDIGLGNMSLRFITLTFFTMCKSSALGFVLIFAFLFRLEKPSWKLVLIILIMTVGVVMMVAGETAFNALGFILVMSSALSSGFRWSLTQILLLRNPATSNPFSSIFFLAPVMFLSLLVIAIPVEGFSALAGGFSQLMETKGPVLGIGILLFPGCLAFLMTSSEFALLKRTSVVTLSICGIFKEVVTISAANIVFDDHLTPINFSGLLITIASIAAYNYIKIKKMRDDARLQAHLVAEEYAPVLVNDPDQPRASTASASGTRGSIRNSLHIPPLVADSRIESPVRQSPIKRPENID